MFSKKISESAISLIRHSCVFIVLLSILGSALYYLIYDAATERPQESIFTEWFTMKPHIDRPQRVTLLDAVKEIPNLPAAYSNPNFRRAKYRLNRTCAPYPNVFQLSFHNLYWQSVALPRGKWYLFAAYYDTRLLSEVKPAAIRILVAVDGSEQEKPFCQIWFSGFKRPVIVSITQPQMVWRSNTRNLTEFIDDTVDIFLVTCPVPEEYALQVADSVSLVRRACDMAKNHLRVVYNKVNKQEDFAVCVTALNFIGMDYSIRIAEWIEMVYMLGAHQIFFYYLHHHENISKVLKYYEDENKVQLSRFSLPGDQPNLPLLQNLYLTGTGEYLTNQFAALQDCLYRNMYTYKYLVVMDIDEIIMPLKGLTWTDLMGSIPSYYKHRLASFCAENFWFYDDDTYPSRQRYSDVPFYLRMMNHVHRTKEPDTISELYFHGKCFHDTSKLKVQGLHGTAVSFGRHRTAYWLPATTAQLQHYCDQHLSRNWCADKANSSVADTNIWRYKTKLMDRLLPKLNKLGFIS